MQRWWYLSAGQLLLQTRPEGSVTLYSLIALQPERRGAARRTTGVQGEGGRASQTEETIETETALNWCEGIWA